MLRKIISSWWCKASLYVHEPAIRRAYEVLRTHPHVRVVHVSSTSLSMRLLAASWIVLASTLLIAEVIIPRRNKIAHEDEFWASVLENDTVGGESVSRGEKEFKKNQYFS
ncbi:hypothetical protein DCAR_0730179 [Daucus carota subsp. sativus]|uniref:Uncharacterized protein n=1 Tax=Daucus carota subsp. sativus TaxID=79200 RepID=A0A164UQ66_DAUCS|nr:PREDICTED: uncharacterized protein LOC108195774 [Daucus carota subsp. sativus]WOH10709.1 hypothetical protein DCAR_0730179 [Daucus carota subsp. sativus]